MKKLFFVLAIASLITACNKDKQIDITYQLTATIDAMEVVKNIKDIDNTDLFPNGTVSATEKVRITFFVYNKAGELVAEETKLVSSFNDKLTVNKSVKEGEYTVVSCADVVDAANLTTIETEYWQFDQKSSLTTCRAKFNADIVWYTLVLGYAKQNVTINKAEAVTVSLKPAGSMVTLDFDYLNLSNIQTIKVGYNTWNDYLSLSDGVSNMLTLLNDGNVFSLTKDASYRNRVRSCYYLESNKLNIKWVGLNAAGVQVKSGTIPSTALTAGVNKSFNIDTNTGIVTTKSASVNTVNGTKGEKSALAPENKGSKPKPQ